MGCCCSCLGKDNDEQKASSAGGTGAAAQMEMTDRASEGVLVSRGMTAPTIDLLEGGTAVSGYGLALVGVTIEQDSAYWEIQIDIPGDGGGGAYEVMCGVATKKDRKFYDALQEQEEEAPDKSGTDLMRKIAVKNKDTVGVAVQQCDLPMVQFLLNGEPLHTLSINRFRGNVYPSVFLPENDGLTARLVFKESDFQQLSPHVRFGPLIVARGLL